MKTGCPNSMCVYYQKKDFVVRDGFYFRSNDSRRIQRLRCRHCRKRFSHSTGTLEYRQKKRRVNFPLFKLIVSGVSLRRSAKILGVNRKTVDRKFVYLAKKARLSQINFLFELKESKVFNLQIDDLITSEHTKLKPLSVSLAVDKERRFLLGCEVSEIPAFGLLANISRKKYGQRRNLLKKGLESLCARIKGSIADGALIESDDHKLYPWIIKKYFPESEHKSYKGARGCVSGQGELKKVVYDPLFSINHTCAMLRANLNRLARKTWCTTKDRARLKDHLDIFTYYYNCIYLKKNI